MRATVNGARNKWLKINKLKYKDEDEKIELFGKFLSSIVPENMNELMEEAEYEERKKKEIIDELGVPKMGTRCVVCYKYTRDRLQCSNCNSQEIFCSMNCFDQHKCK